MKDTREESVRLINLDKVDDAAEKLQASPELVKEVNEALRSMFSELGIPLSLHERRYLLLRVIFEAPRVPPAGYVEVLEPAGYAAPPLTIDEEQ